MNEEQRRKFEMTRRAMLRGSGAVVGGTFAGNLIGCDAPGGGPGLDPMLRNAECIGGPALSPDELLAPVENIVVLMMENRSFDHMFGALSLMEGREDVDGLLGNESNPTHDGGTAEIFELDPFQKLHHLPHKWEPMHAAFNGGRNDGFVIAHHEANKHESLTAGPEVMGFLQRRDMEVMYALADNYTLCDQWHCSVMGPTWPNRFFMHAGESGGRTTNRPKFFLDSIWDRLRDADLKGVNYFTDLPWAAAAMGKVRGFSRLKSFFEDAERGRLPEFSIIDPGFFSSASDHPREFGGDSDHPEMGPNVNLGQLLIATIYRALAESPQWNKTMFIVTYDESGGFFDHVAPPTVSDQRPDFQQLGFRVPSLVIGPHVRSGCINNNLFEHCSIISTAQRRFGLESINTRIDLSSDLSSAINPDFINDPQAPIALPEVEIDEQRLIEKLLPVDTQPELSLIADAGGVPAELDRRADFREDVRGLVHKARDYGLVHPVKEFKAWSFE
ncbi:MAG: alkaline phosphatase family protein [Nannocystaceae bacterium]|nr:alkaline phosphatase family protein [bacterium]